MALDCVQGISNKELEDSHTSSSQCKPGGGDFYAGGAYNRTFFCCCFQVDGPIKKGALLDGAGGGFKAAVYFVTLCHLYV